jgi:hypothetical protein
LLLWQKLWSVNLQTSKPLQSLFYHLNFGRLYVVVMSKIVDFGIVQKEVLEVGKFSLLQPRETTIENLQVKQQALWK